MTYVRIDDNMPWNPKVARLSLVAFRVYVGSICYAGQNTTDGKIERAVLTLIPYASAKAIKELVTGGLWEEIPEGWFIHDYLLYNRSRAQIDEMKEQRRLAGGKGLANRYSKPSSKPLAGSLASRNTYARSALSDPTDPDLSQELPQREQTEASKPSSKPLPLPKKTTPTEEWATEQREKFRGRLRDFDETLRFHMNGSYYRTCADKWTFLEKKLEAAADREAGLRGLNGNGKPRIHPDASDPDKYAREVEAVLRHAGN